MTIPVTIDELFDRADFLERYICHRKDDFALQIQKGGYVRQGRELRYEDILAHVMGEQTVGVYQSSYPAETCLWVMYDIDGHDLSGAPLLQKKVLENRLNYQGIPYYEELSGSENSFHIWIFLNEPTPLHIAYNWSRAIVMKEDRYVFSDEIFPKQACLNVEKPFGNLAKLPLGVHRKNGNWSKFRSDVVCRELETVSLRNWKPVDLILPGRKSRPVMPSGGILEPTEHNLLHIAGVRPCLSALVQRGIQLESYHGHKLRIAIASEMSNAGVPTDSIVQAFTPQKDFDYGKSLYQVESVRGYNKALCSTIRGHCNAIKHLTGFDIESICRECLFG